MSLKVWFIRNLGLKHNCYKHLKLVQENTDMIGYNNGDEWGLFKCACCSKGWQMDERTYEKLILQKYEIKTN